ncbi:hypothetical protein FRB95_010398 [Tulasnella sp. JGI-2019a]|nr:hypothetical protein FRB95_010398 [Tulasnella sp. JGI-2019a]
MNIQAQISEIFSRQLSIDSSIKGINRIARALDVWADNLPGGVEGVVKLLMNDHNGSLELVLTTPSRVADSVRQELLDYTTGGSPVAQEVACRRLLERLAEVFISLPPSTHCPDGLARQQTRLERTLTALDAAKKIKFTDGAQRKHKRGASKSSKASSHWEVDEEVFTNVDCRVPETVEQVGKLTATLRARLHGILKVYLEALRYPDVAKHVRTRYFSSPSLDSPDAPKVVEPTPRGVSNGPNPHSARLNVLAQEGEFPYTVDGLELGSWPVILSHRIFRRLCQISGEDANTFGIAIRKISELSQGLFSDANHVQMYDFGVPIFKAFLFGDQRLIYQIDCGAPVEYATGHKSESQYLRFFDICSIARIGDRFWEDVARQLGRRSHLYKQRCQTRNSWGSAATSPMIFDRASSVEMFEHGNTENLELDEKHFLELHRILATEKFVKLSHETVNIIISDEKQKEDLDLVFAPSSQEYDIIQHQSSSLVLGRGGTGKTTTMLMKILQLQRSAHDHLGRPVRQVFITQSPSLVNKVESYYEKLVYSSSGGSSFCDRTRDGAPTEFSLRSMDQDLIKDKFSQGTKFSDLDDSKFPLFLTFNELFMLLERDFEAVRNDTRRLVGQRRHIQPLFHRDSQKSFEYFRAEIWPRLDQSAKKGFHPALVFSEFMGVIKGSEQTLSCRTGYLDRETYEGLSSRSYPTFAGHRARIYTLFEAYRKLKPPQMLDAPERTHSLIKKLETSDFKPQLDFLYVDEMQDNLLIDASVLGLICQNPHGLFYAGDTAQTISVGSAFRFKDLKQFLYQSERKQPLVVAGKRRPVDPAFFELSINYRSHAGIVDVAAFIVSLINRAFPNAIDMLQREQALVHGPKPIFFMGRADDGSFTRLLSHEDSDDAIELGAGQVIVVRNGQVRAALRKEIGDSALIMTLYETKGLEFNDVILYNFFAHSMASPSDWRALSAVVQESSVYARPFQEDKHRILQSELKSLYVAFTRAREHVWVWDQTENGQGLALLLLHRRLIDLRATHAPVPQVAVRSSTQDWAKQGQELFAKRLYAEASISFRKGQLPWLQNVAEIYANRETAKKIPSASARRLLLFREIADAFYDAAVEAPSTNDTSDLYIQAANCYAEAADNARAAAMFFLACQYTDSAWHYRLAGQLDEAMDIVAKYGDDVDEDVKNAVTYLAKVTYTKKSETKKALSLFHGKTQDYVDFLHDHGFEKQSVVVLEEETAYDQAAEVCIANGGYRKAVDLLLRCKTETAMRRAASVLLDALRKELPFGAARQMQNTKVEELMELTRKVNLKIDEHHEVALLRALYYGRPTDLFGSNRKYIHSGRFASWDLLVFDGFLRDKSPLIEDHTSMASLCGILEVFIDYGRRVRSIARLHDIVSEQELRPLFGISLRASAQLPTGSESDPVLDDGASVHVLPGSLIYEDALHVPLNLTVPRDSNQTAAVVVLPRHIVNDLVRERLLARFNGMLSGLQDRLKGLGKLQVCLKFASTGHCDRTVDNKPCGLWHSNTRYETIDAFNERIRIHLLIITALDNFTATGRREPVAEGQDPNRDAEESRKLFQRYWLARLFQVCHPLVLNLGNLTYIVPDITPDFHSLMAVARQWIEEVLRDQSLRLPSPHMLGDMLTTSMLASYFDYHNARNYAHRSYTDLGTVSRAQGFLYFRATAARNAMMYLFRGASDQRNTAIDYIRYVVEYRVAVDVNVLMGFIEDVCMQAAYIHSFSGEGRHGRLLLPRSWMLRVLRRADPTRNDRTMMEGLVATLGTLTVILSTGNGGRLRLNGQILSAAPPLRRNLHIVRSCQLMATLGYNLGDATIQSSILQILETLKQTVIESLRAAIPDLLCEADIIKRSSGLIRPFILCTSWADVLHALQSSMRLRGPDELILAYQQPISTVMIPGVRCIQYLHAADLQRQLTAGRQLLFLSTVSWSDIPLPSKHTVKSPVSLHSEASVYTSLKQTEGESASKVDVDYHGYTKKKSDAASLIQRCFRKWRENNAASIIQRYFVKYRRRTSGGKAGPTWDAFHERSMELRGRRVGNNQHFLYHILLQGPLPRVMAILSILRDACQRAKKAVDRAMRTSRSDIIEDSILERRLHVLEVLEEVSSLTRAICPASALHEDASVDKVISEVRKVPEICARVAQVAKNGGWTATDDYHLGVNAILIPSTVNVKRTEAKAKRPELNTEDLDDWY